MIAGVVAAAALVLALPGPRDALASWLGLETVHIVRVDTIPSNLGTTLRLGTETPIADVRGRAVPVLAPPAAGTPTRAYTDEPAVMTSPRPAPISSSRDLLIPAFAVFGACVLSIIWACAVPKSNHTLAANPIILVLSFMTRPFWDIAPPTFLVPCGGILVQLPNFHHSRDLEVPLNLYYSASDRQR